MYGLYSDINKGKSLLNICTLRPVKVFFGLDHHLDHMASQFGYVVLIYVFIQ